MSISICVTSFVVLVIKLLVENFLTSCKEKSSTLSKILLRKSREKFAAILATKYPVTTAASNEPKAHKSI